MSSNDGSQSGYAPHLPWCPHVKEHVVKLEKPLIPLDSKCTQCDNTKENWICLQCHKVLCGRFAKAHMLTHSTETGHVVVFGTGDLSFWCYSCESYLDAAKIPQIYQIYNKYHEHAFGTSPGAGVSVPSAASNLGVNLDEIKEVEESPEVLTKKAKALAKMITESKHCLVFTGAGISTGAGIPDFRGPTGVWTMKAKGMKPKAGTPITQALPTLCHMALLGLQNSGRMKFLVSQNIDGLHRRSGIDPKQLSELHGNCYLETCWKCNAEYLRDFDVSGDGPDGGRCSECKTRVPHFCHCTGRICASPCGAKLKDSIIHFKENLPYKDLLAAFENAEQADLVIVLGSSLRVSPACDVPKESLKKGGKLVIVNLQTTPQDRQAHLRVFAKIDAFMEEVMKELKIDIPTFVLQKPLVIGNEFEKKLLGQDKWTCFVRGEGNSPLSDLIQKVEFKSKDKEETCDEEPYELSDTTKSTDVNITIHFHPKCNKAPVSLVHKVVYQEGGASNIQQVPIKFQFGSLNSKWINPRTWYRKDWSTKCHFRPKKPPNAPINAASTTLPTANRRRTQFQNIQSRTPICRSSSSSDSAPNKAPQNQILKKEKKPRNHRTPRCKSSSSTDPSFNNNSPQNQVLKNKPTNRESGAFPKNLAVKAIKKLPNVNTIECLQAAFSIFIGIARCGLDLASEANKLYLPDPLTLEILSYIDMTEASQTVIDDVLNQNRDWTVLKHYVAFDSLWKILKSRLNIYSPNQYTGRGSFFLSLNSDLRKWIWQHRRTVDLFRQLGFGKRKQNRKMNTWELDDMEYEIRNRIEQRIETGSFEQRKAIAIL